MGKLCLIASWGGTARLTRPRVSAGSFGLSQVCLAMLCRRRRLTSVLPRKPSSPARRSSSCTAEKSWTLCKTGNSCVTPLHELLSARATASCCLLAQLLHETDKLPAGIDGLFMQAMERQFPDVARYKSVMQMVTRRPAVAVYACADAWCVYDIVSSRCLR